MSPPRDSAGSGSPPFTVSVQRLWEEQEEDECRAEMRWEPRRALSAGSIPSPSSLMTQQFPTSNLQSFQSGNGLQGGSGGCGQCRVAGCWQQLGDGLGLNALPSDGRGAECIAWPFGCRRCSEHSVGHQGTPGPCIGPPKPLGFLRSSCCGDGDGGCSGGLQCGRGSRARGTAEARS